MLFKEILDQKYAKLLPYFDALFEMVLQNQTHSGDLLLVIEHALLIEEPDPDYPDDLSKAELSYRIGTDTDYHCESTNHDFIGRYVKEVMDIRYEDYLNLHTYSPERSKEIDEIADEESTTIQIEMLIYLKIWEGETFLKKMYQLTRLLNGEDYDWHLTIKTGRENKPGSLSRNELLKRIKSNLRLKLPELSDSIEHAHRPQLRNAIAHSQYATLGRNIWLNNYEEKINQESTIDFNKWTDLFHESLVIFTLYGRLLNKVRDYYYESSLHFNKKKEVRINRIFPVTKSYPIVLYTRDYFKDWSPYPNR